MPEISVIVPVYKAENYLERCVKAIFTQTVTDWELILVDDASPDQSGMLCDAFARQDSRVHVIHRSQNGGAAAARNAGMDAAKGTYITFCDSDDTVSPMWLEHLLEWADEETFPMCGSCNNEQALGQPKILTVPSGVPQETWAYYEYNRVGIAGFLWNALYNRNVIETHHLRLRCQRDKGDYNEDLMFNLEYVRYMKQIVYVGYSDYWYDTREGSLSRAVGIQKMYFDKYSEKYRLWKSFLKEYHKEDRLCGLATEMLYHFLISLKNKSYGDFRRIVLSEEMQSCIREADTSKENPRVIKWIQKKVVLPIWIVYQIQKRKDERLQ